MPISKTALAVYIIIALIIGAAIGYFAKPTPTTTCPECAIYPGKFANPPKEGEQWTVVHGFDAEYPPFTEVTASGEAQGFDIDVIKIIAQKYNWNLIQKPWDWSTIVTALEKGNLDLIASGMTINTERSTRKVWFSIPYYTYIHQIVVRADDDRSLDEILNSGGYVACQIGATSELWADRLLQKGYKFQKLSVNSYVEALTALLQGRAVAMITDSAFLEPFMKSHPDEAAKIKIASNLGGPESYGVATRPGDFYLRQEINEGLTELMSSPQWTELLEKWNLG